MDKLINKEISLDSKSKDKYDAIIIGGGIAGIEAARKLYTFGLKNILVLEARDRLGGRIETICIDDNKNMPIELGANWIHGIVNNPLYELVKQNPKVFYHEKQILFSDEVIYCADNKGNKYDSSLCLEIYNIYRKLNSASKLFWSKSNKSQGNSEYENYEDYIIKNFEKLMPNDDITLYRVKFAILRRLLKQELAEHGCSTMQECSLTEYGGYLKLPGPDFEFPGGFSKLIAYLKEQLPDSLIKLNHAVDSICYDASSGNVQITCFNGKEFNAAHVIVTCPLNYLKRHYSSMFLGNILCDEKINAINKMKMGTVDKIFLIYDDLDFFPKNADSIHPIFVDEPEHQNYDIYNWHKKIFSFDKFYDNVILVWLTGEEAIYVESLDDMTVTEVLTKLLRNVLNNNKIPFPKQIIRTKWNSDPYTLGSYSYPNVNCNIDKMIKDLMEPIYKNGIPRILFAGEATHPRFYSTVHGAYLSGQREARRLLEFYFQNPFNYE